MDKYEVRFRKSVAKDLKGIPRERIEKILDIIQNLTYDPRPYVAVKLTNADQFRLRHGDYRILYSVDDKAKVVEVQKIAHRREAYRN